MEKINQKKTQDRSQTRQNSLPVMEEFLSIQGEGAHSGRAAWFIRLAGCDVGCVWCDVKESWDAEAHRICSVDEMAERALGSGAPMVVITGGEPLMHHLDLLTGTLIDAGLQVHIETSGAHPLSGHFHWITLSPKKFKAPLPEILPLADELKVVVYHKSDFAWAEKFAALVRDDCRLFLQPEWSRNRETAPLILDYIRLHPQWSVSLQIHKYLDVP